MREESAMATRSGTAPTSIQMVSLCMLSYLNGGISRWLGEMPIECLCGGWY